MNALEFPVLLATRGGSHGDPLAFLLVFIVLLGVVLLVAAVRQATIGNLESTARYHVVTKRGVPYCPRCDRQVTYRRDHCRSCGYKFKSYGPTPQEHAAAQAREALGRAESARRQQLAARVKEQNARERAAAHEERLRERREARKKFYRSRGVEPGPFAWFKLWPDWLQFVSIGLLVSLPLVVVLVLIIHPR